MNRSQISVACLVILSLLAFQSVNGHYCDYCGGNCLYQDNTIVPEKDFIFEDPHTSEFAQFQHEAYLALNYHYLAFIFIYSRQGPTTDLLRGGEICKTELQQVVGYFKDDGSTFCLVIYPYKQAVNKATCCESECCGSNTKCRENSYVPHDYLVYCDAFFHNADGTPIGTQSDPTPINEDEFQPPATTYDYSGSGHNGGNTFTGYFAVKHDTFPSVCTCARINCYH